jgi:hypothetical protein
MKNDMIWDMEASAVKWLYLMLTELPNPNKEQDFLINLYLSALEMERKHSIEFAKICLNKALDLDIETAHSQVEQYYHEFSK